MPTFYNSSSPDNPTSQNMGTTDSDEGESKKITQIQSAIVQEVISNPVSFFQKPVAIFEDNEKKVTTFLSAVKGRLPGYNLTNQEYIDFVPRNSILGFPLEKNQTSPTPQIFFPFFSSHFALPVKPGEHVWVVYEEVGNLKIGYWISRKIGLRQVEDVNYTHLYRERFLQSLQDSLSSITNNGESFISTNPEDLSVGSPEDKYQIYSFPDVENDSGGVLEATFGELTGIETSLPSKMTFDDLIDNSVTYKNEFTGEPVPRFTKNCGDLTLQGSNNTLIHLGTDLSNVPGDDYDARIGFLRKPVLNLDTDGAIEFFPKNKPDTNSGMIDLVVGRFSKLALTSSAPENGIDSFESALLMEGTDETDLSFSVNANNYNIMKNFRSSEKGKLYEHYEVDKGVAYRGGLEKSDEGQHSTLSQNHTAARFFLSMKSDPDYLWSGMIDDYDNKTTTDLDTESKSADYGVAKDDRILKGNEKSAFVAYAERGRLFAEDDIKIKNHSATIALDKKGRIYLKSSGGASIILDEEGDITFTPGQTGRILINNYYITNREYGNQNVFTGSSDLNAVLEENNFEIIDGTLTPLDVNPEIEDAMTLNSFDLNLFKESGFAISLWDFSKDISSKIFNLKMKSQHLPTHHNEDFIQKIENPKGRGSNLDIRPVFLQNNTTGSNNSGTSGNSR